MTTVSAAVPTASMFWLCLVVIVRKSHWLNEHWLNRVVGFIESNKEYTLEPFLCFKNVFKILLFNEIVRILP